MSTSSAQTLFSGFVGDAGTFVAYVLTAVLAIAVALLGLGYGWRKLTHHVTGRRKI